MNSLKLSKPYKPSTYKAISESSLRDAVIEFFDKIDTTCNHIHIRIGSDGLSYVDEDTSYCISEDEFNREPGHTITVKHQQGQGQCDLPDDWTDTDEGMESIQDMVNAILEDLEYEYELVD